MTLLTKAPILFVWRLFFCKNQEWENGKLTGVLALSGTVMKIAGIFDIYVNGFFERFDISCNRYFSSFIVIICLRRIRNCKNAVRSGCRYG